MEKRISFSHPEISCNQDGELFNNISGEKLQVHKNHSLSTRGNVAIYRHNGKHKQVSVMSIVYECWHLGSKYHKSIMIDFKDGDPSNCRADNLTRYSKKFRNKEAMEIKDSWDGSWLGSDSVYM